MRLLLPRRERTSPAELASGLGLAGLAPPDRPWLGLNMVSSLDGKAALDGRTKALSSPLDRELLHRLRAQVDAVMVGAGTARAERYGPLTKNDELRAARERQGLAREPLAVLVSGRLELPPDLPLLQDASQRVLVATASDATLEGVRAEVEYLRTGGDLAALLEALRRRHGVRSVLCEGGPTLNSQLLGADLVDELFLSLTPKLVGGAAALTIVAGRALDAPAQLELVSLAEADGELFTRWRLVR